MTEEGCGTTDYERRFRAVNGNFAWAIRGLEQSYLSQSDLRINTLSAAELTRRGIFSSADAGGMAA